MTEAIVFGSGTIVLTLAFLAATALRKRSAAERHAAWSVALATCVLLPLASLAPPVIAVPATYSIAASNATTATSAAFPWFAYVYVSGLAVCFMRIGYAMLHALRVVRAMRAGCRFHNYRVGYSNLLSSPVAWGIGPKAILLPTAAIEWDKERTDVVLLHEAAHLRRNDCWALLLAEIACALYWCNPLVWLAASRLRREQEHAADDEVLNAGADPASYASHLVALARPGRQPILAAGAGARSDFAGRVEAILDQRRVRTMVSRRWCLTTAGALFAVALPLASMQAERERKIYKIGGEVSAPRLLEKREPNYTQEARDAKIEGSVLLAVIIDVDGRIHEALVKRSLDPGLDRNAVEAVKTWRFEPAQKAGEPVAVSANVEVNFRLL